MNEKTAFAQISEFIDQDNPEALDELIRQDKSILEMDTPFGPWISYAAGYGTLRVVKKLVELGADVNSKGGPGNANALDAAASEGRLETVRFLRQSGGKMEVDTPDGNPLISAISEGSLEIVEYLLEEGIDPHIVYRSVTGDLKNALFFARANKQSAIEEYLKSIGCRMPIEGQDIAVNEPTG